MPREAKRKCKWLPEWKKTFPFAEFDAETGMMFCKSCRAFPSLAKGNNLFVGVGGGKIRMKTLQEHSKTTSHSDYEGAQAAKVNPSGTPMACVLQKMSENVREKMTKLFNIAYFVAKEEAPFTMFPSLVDLHHKHGLYLGDTYKKDNACRTFVQAIGQSMKDDLVEKLKNTHFFSVMSDSSVNRSQKDQEMVYLTYVEDGKPVNPFVDIVSLEHAHSQGILDAILVGLRNVGLTEQDLKSRMVGFGCDDGSSQWSGSQAETNVSLNCTNLVCGSQTGAVSGGISLLPFW